ncbi:MAG: RdgB/HAM1 family non-canonical purine NTP pyrophosphatase [Deltaproteobacteria bacterium]|nr:RdgB/HAM1 family non-canonical purine NTP pyrophosphatase [Deltaproteobacteria bacterium]
MSHAIAKLVLATGNPGKKEELEVLLAGSGIALASISDYPGLKLPPETGTTFLENARLKARAVAAATGEWVLSDDSGLVVDALGGAPGVFSARYAGPEADDRENNLKLLEALSGVPDERRGAAFVCVLVLLSPAGEEFVFTGECRGRIAHRPVGCGGFGYDPIFLVAPQFQLTMAELGRERKNALSHRGAALRKLCAWLAETGKKG